jgi:hypothetical protein
MQLRRGAGFVRAPRERFVVHQLPRGRPAHWRAACRSMVSLIASRPRLRIAANSLARLAAPGLGAARSRTGPAG